MNVLIIVQFVIGVGLVFLAGIIIGIRIEKHRRKKQEPKAIIV